MERPAGRVGVYAGAPAASRVSDLIERPGARDGRLIVVDVFKAYPVGNSADWLPRAIAAEGLAASTLRSTAQMRVVEITSTPRGPRSAPPRPPAR